MIRYALIGLAIAMVVAIPALSLIAAGHIVPGFAIILATATIACIGAAADAHATARARRRAARTAAAPLESRPPEWWEQQFHDISRRFETENRRPQTERN